MRAYDVLPASEAMAKMYLASCVRRRVMSWSLPSSWVYTSIFFYTSALEGSGSSRRAYAAVCSLAAEARLRDRCRPHKEALSMTLWRLGESNLTPPGQHTTFRSRPWSESCSLSRILKSLCRSLSRILFSLRNLVPLRVCDCLGSLSARCCAG